MDFEEVFALVARIESVRVILRLVAHLDWTVHHMDMKSTFLNGDLAEEVYVSQPPGFIKHGQEFKIRFSAEHIGLCKVQNRAWTTYMRQ
jgi:hypothetical protein